MRVKLGFLVVIAMVLLWAGGVCTPSFSRKDRDTDLTSLEAQILKFEARQYRHFLVPVWMQIIEATPRSPASESQQPGGWPKVPDGIVIWYGPFGIEYGRTEMRSGRVVYEELDGPPISGIWVLFLGSELALVGLATFCFAPAIRRRWPKIREVVSGWEHRHF